MQSLVLAITGASGAIYAVRLLEVLVAAGRNVHLTMSPAATEVLDHELGLKVDLDNFQLDQLLLDDERLQDSRLKLLKAPRAEYAASSIFSDSEIIASRVHYHHYRDYYAGIASGSFLTDGMVICPCSGGTMAAVATGQSQNLIHRAADVHLKERRKLILVPRESPLSVIALSNMQTLAQAGAVIMPASPGFYHGPQTIRDLVDFIVGRICDQLGVKHELSKRWGE